MSVSLTAFTRRTELRKRIEGWGWRSNDAAQLLRELEETTDDALLTEMRGCCGKHWVRNYVPLGTTCGYCGWEKERRAHDTPGPKYSGLRMWP